MKISAAIIQIPFLFNIMKRINGTVTKMVPVQIFQGEWLRET